MLDLAAHPHAEAVLGAALKDSPAHAYLLHGPAGSGKRAVARAFAGELLAKGAKDPANVKLRAEHGSHPDLTWVTPSGAHEMLRRDVADTVVGAASHTPFEATHRIFVLERVDVMNDEAANALLKTLEEPPSYVVLLLLTNRPTQVLPTIASRCQAVRFDPPTTTQLAQRLEHQGFAPDTAEAAARLSLGDRPGLAYVMDRINTGTACGIVVRHVSDLADSPADLTQMLQWINQADAFVMAVDEWLDPNLPPGRLSAGALVELSQWRSQRVDAHGPNGLGAQLPDIPELRGRVIAMRERGMSLQAIADALNAAGVPTLRGGSHWRPAAVQVLAGYKPPPTHEPLRQNG